MSNSSVYKTHLKVLRSSADLQLYDSEFHTEAALTLTTSASSEVLSYFCQSVTAAMFTVDTSSNVSSQQTASVLII